jgi:ELP3 family radical SAM enzyme/protein acetyltransferase
MDYTQHDFVIEFYHLFHKQLRITNEYNVINTIYQTTLQTLLRTHKKKKLFPVTPRKHDLYAIYTELVKKGVVPYTDIMETVLTSKLVRSSSGVLPISVALDGRNGSCEDDCSMCPNECKANGAEQDIARSYLSSEGTFIRGKIQDFNIVEQIWRRLAELEIMGHPPDKLEFILLGGTFDCFPREYRIQVALDIFYACNMYMYISTRFEGEHKQLLLNWYDTNPYATNSPLSKEITEFLYALRQRPVMDNVSDKKTNQLLYEEQERNTHLTCCRVIGMVMETRPDRINRYSLTQLRTFGCTRIQIGVQSDDDEVLAYNNRGHKVKHSIRANEYIRDNGFKIDIHIMPDLPGTTLEKDYKMVRNIFFGNQLQSDYCKLYPCLDLPYTQTRKWKQSGKWKPIAEHQFPEFLDFLAYTMSIIPPWTRVNRVQRDFPEASRHNHQLGYVSSTIKTNLQQIVMNHMKLRNTKCYDIRSREIRNELVDTQLDHMKLYVRVYRANEGTEFFISLELDKQNDDFNDTKLLGLCRLRIPDVEFTDKEHIPSHYLPVYRNKTDRIARIRELHVYGTISSSATNGNSQHRGQGKFLIAVAESISHLYKCQLITIISGIGVQNYYSSLGYTLDQHEDKFMIKRLDVAYTPSPLILFDKIYSTSTIHNVLTNSIISQKYIPNNPLTIMTEKVEYDHHVYTTIQNGEAEGFSFIGTLPEIIPIMNPEIIPIMNPEIIPIMNPEMNTEMKQITTKQNDNTYLFIFTILLLLYFYP